MSYILGFGSTEQAFVRDEEAAIRAHIEALYAELGLSYFTDDFVAQVRNWIKVRSEELLAESNVYKTATDHPDRYSYYWPTVLDDASNIVVILTIHHVNRRHAMSPDGWAVMRERQTFVFETSEMPETVAA